MLWTTGPWAYSIILKGILIFLKLISCDIFLNTGFLKICPWCKLYRRETNIYKDITKNPFWDNKKPTGSKKKSSIIIYSPLIYKKKNCQFHPLPKWVQNVLAAQQKCHLWSIRRQLRPWSTCPPSLIMAFVLNLHKYWLHCCLIKKKWKRFFNYIYISR